MLSHRERSGWECESRDFGGVGSRQVRSKRKEKTTHSSTKTNQLLSTMNSSGSKREPDTDDEETAVVQIPRKKQKVEEEMEILNRDFADYPKVQFDVNPQSDIEAWENYWAHHPNYPPGLKKRHKRCIDLYVQQKMLQDGWTLIPNFTGKDLAMYRLKKG
jgi:hypothetical protein